MASLPLTLMLQLATLHAPEVAPENIIAFARVESGMNPYALHDNTTGKSYAPKTAADASALARDLLDLGHSIDTGVMQINSENFRVTGLDHITAFKPERSIQAAAMILSEGYQRCVSKSLSVDPLRCMASIYNTGNHRRGERNGYVGRIYAAAERIVPAIREVIKERQTPTVPAHPPAAPPRGCGPPPPAWDGWAVSTYQLCATRSSMSHQETKPNEVDQAEK